MTTSGTTFFGAKPAPFGTPFTSTASAAPTGTKRPSEQLLSSEPAKSEPLRKQARVEAPQEEQESVEAEAAGETASQQEPAASPAGKFFVRCCT